MIGTIRKRFILTAMAAFLAVLVPLLIILNVVNRSIVYADIDRRLTYLADSTIGPPQGMIDFAPEQMREWIDLNDAGIMSETSYFIFSGYMTLDVRQYSTALLSYALGQDANDVMRGILGGPKDFGNVGAYRYYCAERADPYKLVFLRCETEFRSLRTFRNSSLLVGAGFFLVVLLLVALVSRPVMKPFEENVGNQKRFISNASHELKTPLGVIVSDLDMQVIESGPSEWLENAQVQADHLSLLIDQLTTYATLDEKRQYAASVPVDLSTMGEALVSDFAPLARSHGQTLTAEIAPGVSSRGNEDAFRTLFSVLMENAVKYTPDGGMIALRIRKGRNAVIEVENTCGELDVETLDRLFERFYRAPAHRADKPGSGLGLSIAQEIARLYGGSLRASRADGGAIVFTAELPR